jgi:hypothetical protein
MFLKDDFLKKSKVIFIQEDVALGFVYFKLRDKNKFPVE